MKIDHKCFRHGACWVKADFHLHTMADREFSFTGAADDFIPAYVNQLLAADIHVGVITNHNKFDYDEFSRLSSYAANRGVFLLPGVELSVGEGASGIHVLIVFDPSWIANGEDRISRFVDSQFCGCDKREYQQENARSVKSLTETVRDLDQYGHPYFLVFAHVEDSKGLWREMATRLDDWIRPEWQDVRKRTLAFQKVRTIDASKTERPARIDRVKVIAKLGEAAYPAEVEGSDPKSLEDIGARGRSCFVKIGDYSFDTLRFALESHAIRVSGERMESRHSHVKSISFNGGLMNGQTICFSSGLNALIGVRGSGKSSVIECLRYVLSLPQEDTLIDGKYKNGLVAHVLGSGGKVSVEAEDPFGQPYRVTRIYGNQPEIFRGEERQPIGISIGEVVIRHPLCFGQKELSAREERSENDLLERLIGPHLKAIREKIACKKQEIRVFWAPMAESDGLKEKIADIEGEISTIEAQLAIYDKLDVGRQLQEKVDFDHDHLRLENADAVAEQFVEACEQGIAENEGGLQAIVEYAPKRAPEFWEIYRKEYDKFISAVAAEKKDCAALRAAYQSLHGFLEKHQKLIKSQAEKFAEVERTLSRQLTAAGHDMVRPDAYIAMKKKLAALRQSLIELRKSKELRDVKWETLRGMVSSLQDMYLEEYRIACGQVDKINAESTSLKIEYTYRGDKKAFLDHMTDMFRGSGIRGAVYSQLAERFSDYYQCSCDFKSVREIVGDKGEAFAGRFNDRALDLLLWQVPNKTTIMFKGKALSSHSLGQRASALVLFVMSLRENDVIIIDQPEDDLDSQTIYEDVIKLVVKLKPSIQFIFATHNANMPVLGDAEQIVACSCSDSGIAFECGSLDVECQQKRIIEIMEGGSEAFERRKEIYGQWNAVM